MRNCPNIFILALALASVQVICAVEPRGPGGGAGEQIGLTGGADRHGDDPFERRSRDEVADDEEKPPDASAKKYFSKTKHSFVTKLRDARKRIKQLQMELDYSKHFPDKGRDPKDIRKDLRQAEDDLKKQEGKLEMTSDEMRTQVANEIERLDALEEAARLRKLAEQERESSKWGHKRADQLFEDADKAQQEADKLPKGSKAQKDKQAQADNLKKTAQDKRSDSSFDKDRAERYERDAADLEKKAQALREGSSSGLQDSGADVREDILPDLSLEPIIDPAEFGISEDGESLPQR